MRIARGVDPKHVDLGITSHCLPQDVFCNGDTEKLNGKNYSFKGDQPAICLQSYHAPTMSCL